MVNCNIKRQSYIFFKIWMPTVLSHYIYIAATLRPKVNTWWRKEFYLAKSSRDSRVQWFLCSYLLRTLWQEQAQKGQLFRQKIRDQKKYALPVLITAHPYENTPCMSLPESISPVCLALMTRSIASQKTKD